MPRRLYHPRGFTAIAALLLLVAVAAVTAAVVIVVKKQNDEPAVEKKSEQATEVKEEKPDQKKSEEEPVTPVITAITPVTGTVGTVVTITGSGLSGATSVTFGGGVAAKELTVTSSTVKLVVPAGAATGLVTIVTTSGIAKSATVFTVISKPTIVSFTPESGAPGTVITVIGTNFTGTTAVKINGVTATFSVVGSTQVKVTAPSAVATGPITVTTPAGSATSAATFKVLPKINAFTPASGPPGTTVTITGTGFAGASAVAFGGVATASLTVISATSLRAIVPSGAVTGLISITTPVGAGTSAANFTVVAPEPEPQQPGTLGFNTDSYTVAESGGTAAITIIRTGGADGTVTARFTAANGSATAQADFTARDSVVTFGPGITSQSVTITIHEDTEVEGDETVSLYLQEPSGGASLSTRSATLIITDNDFRATNLLNY